jgi:hypothetical protein
MEVFASGMVLSLDDYRSATIVGARMPGWSGAADKGHFEMLRRLADGVAAGQWPITLADQLAATRLSFAVETVINPTAAWVDRTL